MYEQVKNKIDEIINIFDNSKEIKEMKKLKKELLSNEEITSKLDEYQKLLINPYDKKCVEIKKELLKDSNFSKYKHYEDELFLLTLNINSKFKNILKEKSCYK